VRFVLGVDVGGTNLVVAAVAADGSTLHALKSEATRPEEGSESVLHRMVTMAHAVMEETRRAIPKAEFIGAGVGAPGPLDTKRGVVLLTPNLGWVNLPLRDLVQQGISLPTAIDNDANCAVLGECWMGAGRGALNVIGITIGTGIGGGIVIDGRLYHGSSDSAGEIGHTTVEVNGRRCKCGNYGCLEAYASGPAIADRAREALAGGETSIMPSLVGGELSALTAATVYEAARQEDDLAVHVVRETARFLGTGIANLLNIFNPEVVVLAGGVTQAGDALFEPLRAEVRRRAFKPAVDACRIVPGALEGNAGVVGAVATFAQQHGLA